MPAATLEPLSWIEYEQFGQMVYRIAARFAVMRNYRHRPSRFAAHFEVAWTYGNVWQDMHDVQVRLAQMRMAEEAHAEGYGEPIDPDAYRDLRLRYRRLETAINGAAKKHYLAYGSEKDRRLSIDSMGPMKLRNSLGHEYTVHPEDVAKERLREKMKDGFFPMPGSAANRCFRLLRDQIVKQMVFDKMAAEDWPQPRDALNTE